jgi:hypothetical protein
MVLQFKNDGLYAYDGREYKINFDELPVFLKTGRVIFCNLKKNGLIFLKKIIDFNIEIREIVAYNLVIYCIFTKNTTIKCYAQFGLDDDEMDIYQI